MRGHREKPQTTWNFFSLLLLKETLLVEITEHVQVFSLNMLINAKVYIICEAKKHVLTWWETSGVRRKQMRKEGAQATRNPVKGKRWLYANQETTMNTKERWHFPNRWGRQIPSGCFQWCKKPSWVSWPIDAADESRYQRSVQFKPSNYHLAYLRNDLKGSINCMSIGIKLEMSSEYPSENSNQIMTRRDQVKFSSGNSNSSWKIFRAPVQMKVPRWCGKFGFHDPSNAWKK